MKLIELSSINILPTRQRKEFSAAALLELSDSIRDRGLLQAIVLRQEGEHYILVAGERRIRAITDLYDKDETFRHDGEPVRKGFIPYALFSDLDPLAAEEAEADENLRRVNLSWQEESSWMSRLEDIRKRRAEASGLPPPKVADLAKEVRGRSDGINQDVVRRQLIVAKHLDNPLVKGAKDVNEAYKILRREEDAAQNRRLGETVGKTFTAEMHKAFNADSTEWLRACSAEVFDCILTDPPYGMGADQFGDSGGLAEGAHGYADTPEYFRSLMEVFCEQSFRVAKASAHIYVFCDFENALDLRLWLSEAGWTMFRTPLVWYKKGGMRAPWPENGPQRKYELLLYGMKGKRTTQKLAGDVLDFPPDTNLGHAAQKPVALFEDLLRRSCRPGDSVLDPFCGSGTIFPAAHALKLRATGIELDTGSYGVALKRIEALKAQLELGL